MNSIFDKNYSELLNTYYELEKINQLLFDGKTIQAFEVLSKLQSHLLKVQNNYDKV